MKPAYFGQCYNTRGLGNRQGGLGAPALSLYNLILAACNYVSFDNHM